MPEQRLLESADVCEADKAELRQRRAALNPVEVNRRLNEAVALLLDIKPQKTVRWKNPMSWGRSGPRSLISARFWFLGNAGLDVLGAFALCYETRGAWAPVDLLRSLILNFKHQGAIVALKVVGCVQ